MTARIRDKVKELRGELSQVAFAEKLKLYPLVISHLETGKRKMNIELADKLCGGEFNAVRELMIMQLDEDLVEYMNEINRKAALVGQQ